MSRKIGILLLAIGLSVLWYFSIAMIASWTLNRDAGGVSSICLDEKLPEGTIYDPAVTPYPGGDSTTFPIGFDCVFEMTDGSTLITVHPSWSGMVVAVLPTAATLVWGTSLFSRRPGSDPGTAAPKERPIPPTR
jgi:hypothetical protein